MRPQGRPAGDMPAEEVARVVAWVEAAGAVYQVNGGWGVDALVGRQTRTHQDLDVFIDARHEEGLLAWLTSRGYRITLDWRPVRVELTGPSGRVDVHPMAITPEGDGLQRGMEGETYRHAAGQRVVGRIGGRTVVVASPERVRELRRGYPLRDVDRHDLAVLDQIGEGAEVEPATGPGETPRSTRWLAWHEDYARAGSPLRDRRAAVQAQLHRHLDATAPEPLRVISACAGDGGDLLGVLETRGDAHRVSALLVELDETLTARAAERASRIPAAVEVIRADAGRSDVYQGAAPADLVLLCGIFGNVSDADVRATIRATPELCADGAAVIWTRHRRDPDLTPAIRRWFAEVGCEEVDLSAPADALWAVGVHRYAGAPRPLTAGARWFTFR